MMTKKRTTVSIDEDTLTRAKEAGINVSQMTETALNEAMKETDYYFINSNTDTFDDPEEDGTKVYQRGVTVTYGPESYGEKLNGISPGDVIFHYVDDQGVRAEGRVTGYWDGDEAKNGECVYEGHREYHLPTRWLVVLDEEDAITSDEVKEITDRKHPQGTRQKINDSKYNVTRLQEVIRGRAVDY